MNRKDYLKISLLILVAIGIFYPLFYSEYAYTDEFVQLWQYKKGTDFQMFLVQGRYVTEKLFQWLFGNANTIHDITAIRLFSFFGWIACIPVWYFIIKKVVSKEKLPALLVFLSILYLICSPPFSIYVQWASCLEHFIANTAGLLSGYILYSSIKYQNDRIVIPFLAAAFSILFGVISLFTYQNGFGCFLIPFSLYLIKAPQSFRRVFIGIGFYLFTYVVYYLLFKYSLRVSHIEASGRTNIGVDVFPKLKFFFSRPLAMAFHFTYLFNEKNIAGFVVYLFIFLGWFIADLYRCRFLPIAKRLKTIAVLLSMLILVYLPSLIVKETFSSNRTLFALNMVVFFLTANTLLTILKNYKRQVAVASILSVLFVVNAWYNFNKQFLEPIEKEYRPVRVFIEKNYDPNINTVYFIQPHEDFFVKKYGITRSWDEFGVPTTFFSWVPEFFVKQVIFEKTGNHEIAEKMITKQWPDKKQFQDSAFQLSQHTMLVDVEDILNK